MLNSQLFLFAQCDINENFQNKNTNAIISQAFIPRSIVMPTRFRNALYHHKLLCFDSSEIQDFIGICLERNAWQFVISYRSSKHSQYYYQPNKTQCSYISLLMLLYLLRSGLKFIYVLMNPLMNCDERDEGKFLIHPVSHL